MAGSVILAGARTPIGKLSGALGGFASYVNTWAEKFFDYSKARL